MKKLMILTSLFTLPVTYTHTFITLSNFEQVHTVKMANLEMPEKVPANPEKEQEEGGQQAQAPEKQEAPVALETFTKVLHEETTPYPYMTQEDPNLPQGATQLIQQGQKGKVKVVGVYGVDPATGEVTQLDEIKEEIHPVPEVVAVGTSQPAPAQPAPAQTKRLVEGVDFATTWELYPGPASAKNLLYRQDFYTYDPHYGVSSVFTNGNIYYAEVMTGVGALFANLQLGEEVIFDGQLYSVKAIEYPFTAHRDTYIPAYTDPHGVYHPAENTKSLYKHNDYIQSHYYTPTAKMVQVCADPRMYNQTGAGVFTNKIIILDLADGYNYGKGNIYPLEQNNFQPALDGVRF